MIVKMKKVTLLASAKQREETLKQLRKLGALHVKFVRNPQSEDIDRLKTEAVRIEKALSKLPPVQGNAGSTQHDAAAGIVTKILELADKRESMAAQLAEKRRIRDWYRTWGDFSWSSVQALCQAGVFIRLYTADKRTLENLPENKQVAVLGKSGGSILVALIALSPEDKLDLKEENIPPVEAAGLEGDIRAIESELVAVESEFAILSREKRSLISHQHALKKQIEFASVFSGMGVEERFVYIQGFCPREVVQNLKRAAEREGWGYVIEDPDDPAEVPTLIRNPKWIRIIDPLIKFMGTVPGYDEKDISLPFLLFFTMFFAILIGDAGYGLAFIAATFFAQKKAGPKAPKEFFRLLYVSSIATVVWGAVTGTWFSIPQIARLPLLRSLIIPQLDPTAGDIGPLMIFICFVIAVVQLTLAHVINVMKIINSPRVLAEVGWICILWPIFFLAGYLVLGRPMPRCMIWMFTAGALLTLVFSNFQKNVVKGMLTTLTSLPFSILGSFSDTFSYLRLYAVGIAGATVSASFNDMLLGTGHSVLGLVVAVVFLFLIHILNMAMGCMAVIVHGVRLNLLEFSGHLGMSWTGIPYEPFRE
jgi:V/A-type H+-transporting ATPase subunit I